MRYGIFLSQRRKGAEDVGANNYSPKKGRAESPTHTSVGQRPTFWQRNVIKAESLAHISAGIGVLLSMVFLAGCTTHVTVSIYPITNNVGAISSTNKNFFEDFKNLCQDGNSLFWQLPLKEQKRVAELVFLNSHNLQHIQHIGLTFQKGKPHEIKMVLYEAPARHQLPTLLFQKDRKGKWILSGIGMIHLTPWDAFPNVGLPPPLCASASLREKTSGHCLKTRNSIHP